MRFQSHHLRLTICFYFFANITSRKHTPTAAHMTTADNASEKTVDANGSGTFRLDANGMTHVRKQ